VELLRRGFSLTADDLVHQVGPVRNLIRAKEKGAAQLLTLCSMCYNTLPANRIMRDDAVKRDTINRFMDDEIDYAGEVEVVHMLTFLEREVGWQKIREKVRVPLEGLRVAPYYGCTLQRPADVGIEPFGSFNLMTGLLTALGATVTPFDAADKCCGSYQVLNGEAGARSTGGGHCRPRGGSRGRGPGDQLSALRIQPRQAAGTAVGGGADHHGVPTFYFTQLLAVALGVAPESCLSS